LSKRLSKKWLPLAATIALGVGLVACGDDSDSSSEDTTAAAEATADTTAPADTTATADTTAATEETAAPATTGGDWSANFKPWEEGAAPVACGPKDGGPLKAAWVYVGPINDGGWTQTHDEARVKVQEHFGDKVETTYKENVPEGEQVSQGVEDLIADGNTVIFGTSFGFQDAFLAAAEKHPDVCFEFATGYKSAGNLSQFYGAAEDTDYLAGMAAGAASKTGKIGHINSFGIPEVVRGINAFTLGARAMNPEATVKIVWVNSWFDPPTERKQAEALIAAGVDVLGMKGIDSPATGDAAKAAGIPWAGYNRDNSANYGEVWLTGTQYHWEIYQIPRLQQVLDGAWVAGNYYGNIADGFVGLSSYGDLVSEETRAKIEAKKAELAANPGGEFTGPIVDTAGKEQLAAGKQHTYEELMSMAYLVEGVDGEIPAG
jgi:basic membrane lipoprotein Med (substrate-binding protein (PBP1-ABC) superfamily)